MKKQYITPEIHQTQYMSSLMQNIGVGSTPDDDEEILGKGRNDDYEGTFQEKDNWSNGLW